MRSTFVIFGRAPGRDRRTSMLQRRAGRVLLRRTVHAVRDGAQGAPVVLLADGIDELRADGIAAAEVRLVAQRGDGFEARLLDGLQRIGTDPGRRLVVVAADTPELDAADLRAAASAADGEAVVGPAPDGGIYLLSVPTDLVPALAGLPWCTSRLLPELRRRLESAGLAVRTLAPKADVDDTADAIRLRPVLERISRLLLGCGLDDVPDPHRPRPRRVVFRPGARHRPLPGRAPPAFVVA